MLYIALAAVTGILLLQSTGAIPLASVGGSLTIGLCFLVAALAVGLHEAWTKKRGVLGWIVNVVVTFVGALVGAQFGGLVVVGLIGAVMDVNGSLARTGGLAMSAALAGGMLATLLGAWIALWIVNRWRSDPKPA
jgi:uncharacterized membrane protein YeaQ/YmgE (transglycosylase-associated protein family)